MAVNKSQSVAKLLASIEVALSEDSLTDAKRESLLEAIRAHQSKPVARVSAKTGLLKLAGYEKHLIPFWEQYEQRDNLGILHRQGRPGWKLVKESILTAAPCFCCLKPLSFGKLGIIHPREGYRLAHYGCALNWDRRAGYSIPSTIAQVVTDCANAARISFQNGIQSLHVEVPAAGRCEHRYIIGQCADCGMPGVHLKQAINAGIEVARAIDEAMTALNIAWQGAHPKTYRVEESDNRPIGKRKVAA